MDNNQLKEKIVSIFRQACLNLYCSFSSVKIEGCVPARVHIPKAGNSGRISEQELKMAFIEVFLADKGLAEEGYTYSVETPTERLYKFSKDGKPVDKLICGSGRRGNIDLTIYDHNGKSAACIIEFKARNDGEFSHGKDLFKLANEPDGPIRFFVEIYARTDNATVVSISRILYKNKYFNIADNTEYLGFSLCHKGSESGYCFFIDNQSDILDKNNI